MDTIRPGSADVAPAGQTHATQLEQCVPPAANQSIGRGAEADLEEGGTRKGNVVFCTRAVKDAITSVSILLGSLTPHTQHARCIKRGQGGSPSEARVGGQVSTP